MWIDKIIKRIDESRIPGWVWGIIVSLVVIAIVAIRAIF
jgi:hypothetical protein